LEDLGHVVIEAPSGATALELLRASAKIDVIITDHAMPNMTGVELASLIRQQWPWIPVILASGYADLMGIEKAPLERLAKPYTQREVASCIEKVLDERKIVPIDVARSA
jgi:CheY-like chemotaxis protein